MAVRTTKPLSVIYQMAKYRCCVTAVVCDSLLSHIFSDNHDYSASVRLRSTDDDFRQETFCYFNFDRRADNGGEVQSQQMTHHWKEHDLSFLSVS